MRIFIATKAPHGQAGLEQAAFALADAVSRAGHTPFLAWQEIARRNLPPVDFMPLVRQSIGAADLLLLLNHPELRGGWIEVGIAYALGIPVWVLRQPRELVSSSALGCASRVLEYQNLPDLAAQVISSLESLERRTYPDPAIPGKV